MESAKYVSRVGALAVALGLGLAVSNSPALAESSDGGGASDS